ncbi:hypothetical protein [Parapedobacter indicus]|uniref:Uncharacterized protein n=1 Tax=Parapedobacter indicus TaxID=1477437 RepID=A0A1I3E5A6_9SPHI|nr:hypothetical protein [Parapedobacter indicus]PPL04975.1 hypothetical protein CLV26_101786 [Parapedobacter indicus]SFH94190.1 hypothetical protein SAMN05444682_101772 [Parapedobacter indicus]
MIQPTFNREDIQRALKQNFRDKLYRIFLRGLRLVGEKAVAHARGLNTYMDQTGNLRSSIGYAIYHDGTLVERNFRQVIGGAEGVSEGERHAASNVPRSGFALVVVAGMDYAMAVQSRGLDVLDGAELEAEKELDRYMRSITDQINRWAA